VRRASAGRRRPSARLILGSSVGRTALAGLAGLLLASVALPAAAMARGPALTARAAIVYSPQTGQTLYAYNAYREQPIASTTKLMTALVVLKHIHHLGTVFTEPNYYAAAADSQIGLVPRERMTVHDLLLALMLPSADDAAEDLAYNIAHTPGRSLAGSVARFVAMMNAQARALGLHQTHYTTPIGLDTPGNYSSPSDLVRLAAYDMSQSRFFARIVALHAAVLHSGSHVRYIVNRNDLVARYPWINGVKTGHTAAAGYVLVASGHQNGMSLLTAVLGTSSMAERDANSLALLHYGFATYRLRAPVHQGQVMARPAVRYQAGKHVPVVAAASLSRVVARSAWVFVRVRVPAQLTGPMARHAVVGTATVLIAGRPVGRVHLLLAQALPAVSPITIAADFITRPLMLVVVVILVAGLVAVALLTRQCRRPRAGKGGLEPA
jgi:D-alanyl-D-alanine carboxypeptidase (penicillin-binding protein 5/6)